MADSHTASSAGRFEVRPTASDHFAWLRTRLSLERTMMSWVRTAVALIGFGFAIVQYLEHLEQTPEARAAYLPHAPRYLGLAMIACGILALVISIWQRTVYANRRRHQGGKANPGHGCRHCAHFDRPVRLLCRAIPSHLATKPSNWDP